MKRIFKVTTNILLIVIIVSFVIFKYLIPVSWKLELLGYEEQEGYFRKQNLEYSYDIYLENGKVSYFHALKKITNGSEEFDIQYILNTDNMIQVNILIENQLEDYQCIVNLIGENGDDCNNLYIDYERLLGYSRGAYIMIEREFKWKWFPKYQFK